MPSVFEGTHVKYESNHERNGAGIETPSGVKPSEGIEPIQKVSEPWVKLNPSSRCDVNIFPRMPGSHEKVIYSLELDTNEVVDSKLSVPVIEIKSFAQLHRDMACIDISGGVGCVGDAQPGQGPDEHILYKARQARWHSKERIGIHQY